MPNSFGVALALSEYWEGITCFWDATGGSRGVLSSKQRR